MNKIKHTLILMATVFSVVLFCTARGGGRLRHKAEQGDTIKFSYARLLTMVRYEDHVHVVVKDPWHQGQILQEYDVKKPFQHLAVFSSPHTQLLLWLGAGKEIAGVCDLNYMVIPSVQKAVAARQMYDFGSSMSPDVESIVSAGCDAILLSPFENSGGFGKLEKIGVTLIQAADYMEPTALGRAEWMKLYGVLTGHEREADSLFSVVEKNYKMLCSSASKLKRGRSILTERKTGATWYTPGGRSTIANILRDANAGYAFYQDGHTGSLALSPEEVIDKAGNTDVWAFKVSGPTMMTRSDLLDEYHGYAVLKALKTGEVYECLSSRVPYFEEVAFRPDYLLREYILLSHLGEYPGALRYFKKLQ